MNKKFQGIAGAIVALSLATSSTASMAGTAGMASAPAPVSNPWTALSMMATSSAYDRRDYEHDHARAPLPLLPLAAILATIAVGIWIALSDNDDDDGGISIQPRSPS